MASVLPAIWIAPARAPSVRSSLRASTEPLAPSQASAPRSWASTPLAPGTSPFQARFMSASLTEPLASSGVSVVLPASVPLSTGWRKSALAESSTGAATPSAMRPVASVASTSSPSSLAVSSLMRARTSESVMRSMSKASGRDVVSEGGVVGAASFVAALPAPARSSVLRLPCASRSSCTRTPLASTRPTTTRPESSGSTSTASAALSIAANCSLRPASERLSWLSFTATRGNTESSIGPLMASVRLRFVFIHSTATPL